MMSARKRRVEARREEREMMSARKRREEDR